MSKSLRIGATAVVVAVAALSTLANAAPAADAIFTTAVTSANVERPVISDAAKTAIRKSVGVQEARVKFRKAFVKENGPSFAEYRKALSAAPSTHDAGQLADIRSAFESIRAS